MREINRTRSKAIREIRCPLLHYHSTDKRFAHSKDPRVVQSCMHDIRSAAHLTRPSDLNKPWFAYDRSGFRFSSSPIMLLQEVHLLCRGGVPFLLASDTRVYTILVLYLQTSANILRLSSFHLKHNLSCDVLLNNLNNIHLNNVQ